jgi:hypothetical protein
MRSARSAKVLAMVMSPSVNDASGPVAKNGTRLLLPLSRRPEACLAVSFVNDFNVAAALQQRNRFKEGRSERRTRSLTL